MNYDDPDLLDRLAAEYVFGSLSLLARRRFDRLRERLPAAERAVRDWERRLMPLSGSVPSERPPERVWTAIDERTGGSPHRASPGWRNWLRPVWGFAFGVVAALGIVRLFPDTMPIDTIVQQRGTLPQSYVGLLTDVRNSPVLLVSSTRYGRIVSIKRLRAVATPPGQVAVLWALPRDRAPFVLGAVPLAERATLTLADTSEKLLSDVPQLALSFETGLPEAGATPSPFILTGHCVKLW